MLIRYRGISNLLAIAMFVAMYDHHLNLLLINIEHSYLGKKEKNEILVNISIII